MRYIQRISSVSLESAEDILQEVFIKVYRNLNDYDPQFSFSPWIYRIAHNETINSFKKLNKLKTIPLETDEKDAAQLIQMLQSDDDLPQALATKEHQEKVQSALQLLTPAYRDVLILRYLEDMDYQQISDVLHKPIGTVATLINRAKYQFKDIALKLNLKPL
ncbi:RNA polymerase sigma factor [Candidatus Peregrinibacteria bacterium]|nr:MAG: RNA polymerase sigma factor [Candidatus Peregrinibacteria bacterium]